MNPPSHLRFIVANLTAIAILSMLIGGALIWKGFTQGELFVTIGSSVAGGLVGMISMRNSGNAPAIPAAPTVPDGPAKPTEATAPE